MFFRPLIYAPHQREHIKRACEIEFTILTLYAEKTSMRIGIASWDHEKISKRKNIIRKQISFKEFPVSNYFMSKTFFNIEISFGT